MIINLPKLGPVRFNDNLTQEQFNAELTRLSTKYDFELPKRDYGLMGSFTKGVSRGATRMGETFGDVLPALGASALGFDEYAQKQLQEARATEEQLARQNPAQFESYKQVGGVRDAAKYALETLGEFTPDIGAMIGTGGVGSAIAKRGAAAASERLLAKELAGGATEAEAAKAVAQQTVKRQAQGQGVGVYLGSYAMAAPEVFQGIYQDSGQLAPGASLLFGSVSAALDSVLPQSILRSMSPAAKVKVTEEILKRSGMRPGLAKNIGASVLKGMGTEGLTEGAQEAINIAAQGFVNENRDMWTSKDFNNIVENSVRGAIGGGAFGTVGGFAKNAQQKEAVETEQARQLAEIQAERDRQSNIAAQAQAEQATREMEAQQKSRANLPMDLPGFEPAVGPEFQPAEVIPKEVVPEEQGSLFTTSGKPTPEALASVKAGPLGAKRAEKEAAAAEKAAVEAQKKAIEELAPKSFDILRNVRRADTGLSSSSPLQSLIDQAQEFGPKVKPTAKPAEAKVEEAPATNIVNDAVLKSLGIGPTASIRKGKVLDGLDPAIPEDAARIRQVLETYLDSPKLSGAIAEKVDAYLSTIPEAPVEAVAPQSTEVIPEEQKTPEQLQQGEAVLQADLTAKPPLSAEEVSGRSEDRLLKEDIPAVAAEYITSEILDNVKTDLDIEGVPTRASGRVELAELEAFNIRKNINKQALMKDVVEPIRAVNILREALDLARTEEPTAETAARLAELEKVMAGFDSDLPSVYAQLKTKSAKVSSQFFDAVNADTKAVLSDLIKEAKQKTYPKSKTSRVFIPEDINKDDLSSIVAKRKKELVGRNVKQRSVKDLAADLAKEIDKFIGKAGRAYMVEETPPEVLKVLSDLIEAIVREGIRSLKDVMSRIRAELGDNVFRTIKRSDIVDTLNQVLKAEKSTEPSQKQQATVEVNAPAEVYNSLPQGNQKIYDNALNTYSNAQDTIQKSMLSLWSLNDMIDVFGNTFPTLKNLLTAIEKRASTSTRYRQRVSELVTKGEKLIKSLTPEMADRFNSTVLEVSRLRLDPRPGVTKDANQPAVKQFRALPKDLQDYAIALADQYDAYGKQYLDFLINQTPMKNNREYLTNVEKMKAKFESGRIPFYLPFLRSGEHWVSYKDTNGERVVFARESKREAEQLAVEIAKAGGTEIQQYTKMAQIDHRSAPPTGFMAEIVKDLQAAKVSDTVINGIYSSYLDLFPAESLRQQFRPREGTKGFDKDIVQGFAQVGSRMAQQLANMEFAPDIGQAIAGVRQVYDAQPTMANRNVVENILKQESFLSNPVAQPLASKLSYASYFQYILGNPSSAIINLSQLPIVVYSLLGGKYGFGKAASAMTQAIKTYFKDGGWDNNAEFMPDWTFGANAKGDLADLYRQAVDRSALRRGVGYELTEMRKTTAQDYTGTRTKIEHGLGYIFQNSERFNREVTLLATYNLAKQSGKSHQQAVEEAIKLNTDAHSHALSEAGPQLFQQGWGKVITTFKRFAQAQIALLLKLYRNAFKGESKEVRDVARRQLLGIFGMAYTFSGLQGMPLYGAAEVLAGALFGDDDEPFDLNEKVREAFGDLGYKGPVNQLTNLDIASRTGFNGMLWRDDARRLAEVGPLQYATEHLMGPAYSVFYINPKRALDYLDKGQTERALETVLPSFIKNAMKGVRFATEGALNSKGVPIVDDINAYSALMQIFGFTPATLSEAYARAGVMKAAEQQINTRKTALLDALYLATSVGDSEGMADAYEKIANFNAAHPESQITTASIRRSKDMHEKAMTQYVDGVRLNPKMKATLIENYGS